MKCQIQVSDGKLTVYPAAIQLVKPLMAQLGQPLQYESIRHPPNFEPLFQRARRNRVSISKEAISKATLEELWKIHDAQDQANPSNNGATLLDLKIEIVKRLYENCCLCGHRCQISRFRKKGKCDLLWGSYYDYWGELVGEEAPINPAAGVALYGCTWHCAFCHAHDYLGCASLEAKPLDSGLWREIDYSQCQTIQFSAAGDPIPNLLSILEALRGAPEDMRHPIVWSSNSYGSKETWTVLNSLVDVFLIDLKFENDNCAFNLAGCPNHNQVAIQTLEALRYSSGKKIVRWLQLPGHLECCGQNIIRMLEPYNFYISLVEDFIPDNQMEPSRRNTEQEIQKAREMIESHGLKNIYEQGDKFWK